MTSSGNCSRDSPTPESLNVCLQTGEWIDLTFDVLQFVTNMELTFSGETPQDPPDILLEYRDARPDWHTINVTAPSAERAGFPLVRPF